jgi:hypothetical protein
MNPYHLYCPSEFFCLANTLKMGRGIGIMTQTVAEILILSANALGAGLLLFIAGVVQRIMNTMDEHEFKRFLNVLDKTAMGDPITVTFATIPPLAAIIYFIAYGFNHWWFIAGVIVWIIGSSITKVINMPVYEWVADPTNTDPVEMKKQRQRLQFGNNTRAWLTLASVVIMACQFGVIEVAIATGSTILITPPLLWLASKFIPGKK